ncbi:MAG TPA: protein phosphatase 2C domain-containing protein [Longimicrobiales bacterium]|nr:protein phosphatase 2C domain-containing protein [Longimicrobiales bacterium]
MSAAPGPRSAAVTACGRRPLNEDAVLIATLPDGGDLVAVADGMGGLAAGDVASRLALQTLHRALAAGAALEDAVRAANAAVWEEAKQRGLPSGMGTTLVALLRRGDSYQVANVGDSRAYRMANGTVSRLTRDHSFVAEAVQSGRLTLEEASRSRWKNAVTRAIGTEAHVEVDCVGPFDATEPHATLLCTDGLYRVMTDETLHRLVGSDGEPGPVVDALTAAALDAGADDNVSVALIRFDGSATVHGMEPTGAAEPEQRVPAPEREEPASQRSSRQRVVPAPAHAWAAPEHTEWAAQRRWYVSRRQREWPWIQVAMIAVGLAALTGFIIMLAVLS